MTFAAADVCADATVESSDWSAWHSDLCVPWKKSSFVRLTDRMVGLSTDLAVLFKYIHTPRKVQF